MKTIFKNILLFNFLKYKPFQKIVQEKINNKLDIKMEKNDRYDSLIQYYANKYNLDWLLLKAQIKRESNFNPDIPSPAGAVGLAQFMIGTWGQYGKGNRNNPEESIKAQCKYMSYLLKLFKGDISLGLAAYNCGEGKVGKLRKIYGNAFNDIVNKLPEETQKYVPAILEFYTKYQN